jgi:O-antigen/teichoic acid export membrane protein
MGDGIVRNATFALAVQITVSVFSAALTLFLVRSLGPAGYGLFALSVAIGIMLALLAELGISSSAARFVAERRGDRDAMASVMAAALRLKLPLSALVSLALLAGAGTIADAYDNDALRWPLRAIALALFGQSLAALFGGSFVAQGRVALNLRLALSTGAVELGTSVALVLLGAGATGAAFGRAAGWSVAAMLGLVYTVRVLGRRAVRLRGRALGGGREIVRYAGALAVVDTAVVLFDQVNALLIGAFLTAPAVGLFQAPMRLTTLLLYPGYAIANGVAPRLARGSHGRPNAEAMQIAFRVIVLFQAALLAPVVIWAGPIAELLFGEEFAESADVLRWLAPFVLLSGLAPLVSLGANYLGLARRRAPIAIAAVLVNVVAAVVLIPSIGITGAAIGTSLAYAIYVPAHVWICWRALDLRLWPIWGTVVRSLTAATAMGVVLLLAGTETLSVAEWIAGTLGGGAAYLGVLAVTGELTAGDFRALRRRATRRRSAR